LAQCAQCGAWFAETGRPGEVDVSGKRIYNATPYMEGMGPDGLAKDAADTRRVVDALRRGP